MFFDGREIYDDQIILDYSIQYEDTLFLLIHPLESTTIYINALYDSIFSLEVELADITESVKQIVRDKRGIPVKEQTLIFKERQLENYHTLKYFNTQK